MGACGCCNGFGDFRFAGPNGGWYTLQIYTGCTYCDEGPGVNLSFYPTDSPMLPEVLDLPVVEIGEIFGVPTTDWATTAQQLKENWPDNNDVTYLAEDELPDAIVHGAQAIAQRWLRQVVYRENKHD